MPEHVVSLVTSALNSRGKAMRGSTILVLGVAFKADVSDDRNTPARPIMSGLAALGAQVPYHDPRLPRFSLAEEHDATAAATLTSVGLTEGLDSHPDCVVIVTAHSDIDWKLVFARAELVVDTRDASHGHPTRPGQVLRLGSGWS